MRPQRITGIAMIIGAMKSGTTSLFFGLEDHPQIAPAKKKETNFFGHPERWGRGIDWYDGMFDFDPSRHKWALDGSTDQTKFPYTDYVIDRMRKVEGVEWKFLYVMRHPLRRIESHHKHSSQTGHELMRLEADDQNFSFDHRISPVAVDVSRYAYQLDHYVEAFGRERIKTLLFEDLVADWEGEIRSVRRFLDIDDDLPVPEQAHRNKKDSRPVKASRYAALKSFTPLRTVGQMVPKAAKKKLREELRDDETARYKLNAEEEARLTRELAPDLRRLRDVYGVDVEGKWGLDIG